MAWHSQRAEKPSIGSLLGGLVTDVKDLFAQELKLARKEIGEDIQKARHALTALAVGLGIVAMSLGLLLLMLVHLLDALTDIPLWGCYGIVGIVVGVFGAGLLIVGKNSAEDLDFTPQQTTNAVKEDVGWIRARVISTRIAKGRGPLSVRK